MCTCHDPVTFGHADPMYGYTLAALDNLAARVVRNNMHWWPAGDRADQHDTAWAGIAEYLCTAAGQPSERDLLEAGRVALARETRDQQRHHGARSDGTNNGAGFARYWSWHSLAGLPADAPVVDRVTVRQILPALTTRQRQALDALAIWEDYELAARALGIEPQTFRSLIGRGRREFLALWHEGEQPSRPWGTDRRVLRRETADRAVLARRARDAAAARARRAGRKTAESALTTTNSERT